MSLIESYNETIVRDNANHNKSFSGLQAYLAGEQLKEFALNQIAPVDAKSYKSGDLHIHNLDSGFRIPYCHGGSLMKLLMMGLKSGDISCRPAKHLDTAVDHIANYLIISQQEFSGAQAFGDFNTLLAPFIRADKLTYEEVKQCLQRLFYNLNFPTRCSFQTPFTNLTFNLFPPKMLADLPAIVGGKNMDSSLADYTDEADMITTAACDILLEGDGTGRPLTFPIPTLNLTHRANQNSMAYEKILESVVKLGSWYFMNYIGSGIDENNVRAMCCRLNLNLAELSAARGLWNMGDGTGSLGVVSLNAGRLGYLTRKGVDIYNALDELLARARRILMVKRRLVTESYNEGNMPLAAYYDLNLDHYFNTIGLIGLNEMFMNLDGYGLFCHVVEAGEILDYINTKLKQFQGEDEILYNLEMTPGEGSCYSLALKDHKTYPDIKTQGPEEAPYYSTLLTPPSENIDWLYRAAEESKLLPKFSGGTVFRMYLAREDDPDHTREIINRLAENTIPYFDFTPTIAYCPKCQVREVSTEPRCKCGGTREIWSRVVGYVRPVAKWNAGKQAEYSSRNYVEYG